MDAKKTVVPTDDPWQFLLSVPGWAVGINGDVGVGKHVANVNVPVDKVIRSIDMAVLLRGEVSKGRLGLMADYIYMGLSDSERPSGVVKKLGFQVDETMGQLTPRWRLMESPRGSLDIYAGARYASLYQQLSILPNDEQINETSVKLARAGTDLRQKVREALSSLDGGFHPPLPVAPLGAGIADKLVSAISKLHGTEAERAAQIDHLLRDSLDQRLSMNNWWIDPVIGLRGRLNLDQRWYLTARGDVGGFGVGSKFSWQTEAALGFQITPNVFAEAGYRALGMDYQGNGLIYDAITHGAQLTMGVNF